MNRTRASLWARCTASAKASPLHVGHHEIREYQIDPTRVTRSQAQRMPRMRGLHHHVRMPRQHLPNQRSHRFIVFDEQDGLVAVERRQIRS